MSPQHSQRTPTSYFPFFIYILYIKHLLKKVATCSNTKLVIKLINELQKVRLINLICYTVNSKTKTQARSSSQSSREALTTRNLCCSKILQLQTAYKRNESMQYMYLQRSENMKTKKVQLKSFEQIFPYQLPPTMALRKANGRTYMLKMARHVPPAATRLCAQVGGQLPTRHTLQIIGVVTAGTPNQSVACVSVCQSPEFHNAKAIKEKYLSLYICMHMFAFENFANFGNFMHCNACVGLKFSKNWQAKCENYYSKQFALFLN